MGNYTAEQVEKYASHLRKINCTHVQGWGVMADILDTYAATLRKRAGSPEYTPTDAEVRDWMLRSDLEDDGRIDHWRAVIDDARSMHMLDTAKVENRHGQ